MGTCTLADLITLPLMTAQSRLILQNSSSNFRSTHPFRQHTHRFYQFGERPSLLSYSQEAPSFYSKTCCSIWHGWSSFPNHQHTASSSPLLPPIFSRTPSLPSCGNCKSHSLMCQWCKTGLKAFGNAVREYGRMEAWEAFIGVLWHTEWCISSWGHWWCRQTCVLAIFTNRDIYEKMIIKSGVIATTGFAL